MVPVNPVDGDELTVLEMLPQPAPDAARPLVVATDQRLFVAYQVPAEPSASTTGSSANELEPMLDDEVDTVLEEPVSAREPAVLVEFRGAQLHMFRSAMGNALTGHPLADRGLHSNAAFEVRRSSWARSVAESQGERQEPLRHFILAFAASMFECLATGFRLTALEGVDQVRAEIDRRLQRRDITPLDGAK